jgi:hypothetical protein
MRRKNVHDKLYVDYDDRPDELSHDGIVHRLLAHNELRTYPTFPINAGDVPA